MGQELSPTELAIAHDMIILSVMREQEVELTPEEQAMVDHDLALWRDKTGVYRRDVDEENAFIEIDGRIYRVRRAELRHG